MDRQEVTFARSPTPDPAQIAAWRALWRILLTPRPQSDGKVQHPAE